MSTSFWQDRPTFITGATGLLGGWLVKNLVNSGADIVCLVRDWAPHSVFTHSNLSERVNVVRGDICDRQLIERILGEYEINTVFHLAAQTIVGIANRNPISTLESNIRGTWTLLEACRRSPTIRCIISASSDKAYGDQLVLPYTETTPLQGTFPYDVSKSCADLIAQSYAATYKLPVAITRCGNFYGGGDLNWNRIVPGTIRSILRQQQPVIRSNGKFIRDYFYIEDGVAAYVLLAEKLIQNQEFAGQAFNFSNETPISVIDIVQRILKAMNSKLTPTILNEPVNEIHEQYLDSGKARHELGWQPSFSLDDGLNNTIDWYREYFNNSSNLKSQSSKP